MALIDEEEDLLALCGFEEKTLNTAQKGLQALKQKQQQRVARQQESEQRRRQRADLDALQAELDDENNNSLAQQEQKMDELGAKVVQELDKGDSEAGGPEPEAWMQVIHPVQPLPPLQLDPLPQIQSALQQQRQLLGLPSDPTSPTPTSSSSSSDPQQLLDTFVWLLQQEGGPFERCPSEAVAQAVFRALCYGPSSSVALAAYTRFMAWCGEPEVLAGSEVMGLGQLLQWAGGASRRANTTSSSSSSSDVLAPGTVLADCMPPSSILWLPSAQEVLQVLDTFGCRQQQQQQQQQGHSGQQQQQQQQQGLGFRHGNLPLLLKLLGRVARGHAAGRLDASGLVSSQQHHLSLLLSLLGLMLDKRAVLTCRCCLQEAFAALLELPQDAAWDRLLRDTASGSLLAALSGGLGPSHRSALLLLDQMPRSARGTQLRQLGALQLMGRLIPKAKAQVPSARISSMDPQQLRTSLHGEVKALLGPEDRVRALLTSLSQPPGPGGELQVWVLSSVLQAAHLVLWADVSTPGVGIGPQLRAWLLEWLGALDRVMEKKIRNSRVRSQLAEQENAYRFAEFGCVIACGD